LRDKFFHHLPELWGALEADDRVEESVEGGDEDRELHQVLHQDVVRVPVHRFAQCTWTGKVWKKKIEDFKNSGVFVIFGYFVSSEIEVGLRETGLGIGVLSQSNLYFTLVQDCFEVASSVSRFES
jgi:hypothetical protein